MNLALSLFASQIPNLMDVRIYADWLLHQGDRLRASGDAAGATACYWRVADFAQRMGLDSHDVTIERLIALAIAEPRSKSCATFQYTMENWRSRLRIL